MHEGGAVEGQKARPCERLAWAVHKFQAGRGRRASNFALTACPSGRRVFTPRNARNRPVSNR